jgi:nicotinate-nucleotide adenylyltransferase
VRIGILGGTFNPPHLGHLVCAQEAYLQLHLDRVMLMPAWIPPHKPVEDEPGANHRLEMCRLAFERDEGRFQVSDLEVKRAGTSYTVDTLEELHSRAPDSELYLIVGADIAAGLLEWRDPERVLSLAALAVAERPGTEREAVERALSQLRGAERARFFDMPEIGVSSTMLRNRVREGQPIRYLTTDPVAGYVARHNLYRRESANDS